MNKFDLNKLYIFSKEKYRLHNGEITPVAELLHNKIVNVEDEHMGVVTADGEDYIVFPHNCNEISVEVYSDEEGNVYNEIENEQDNSNEKYILKEGFISMDNPITSFLDKLLSIDLDNGEEKEEQVEDDRLDKFDLNKKYIFDKNLISNDIVVGDWVDRLNKREVDVRNELLGYIYDEESDFNYFISSKWCRELKED